MQHMVRVGVLRWPKYVYAWISANTAIAVVFEDI